MELKTKQPIEDLFSRLGSEMANAACWSIHGAKTQFSQVVKQAQEGVVQLVENQRERGSEPVVVISVKQLESLLGKPEERLVDAFRPLSGSAPREPLIVRPRAKPKARVKLQ